MKHFRTNLLFITVLLLIGLITYPAFSAAAKIKLLEIGPNKVKAGVGFNIQPNGSSAMCVKTEQATKDTVIVWGDSKLQTAYKNPKLLTAGVPNELFSKPGDFKIYLLDQKTNQKSNSVTLVVQ